MNVIVSIGRNVGAIPMPAHVWRDFRDDMFRVVSSYCTAVYFSGDGFGFYESSPEDSYTVIGEAIEPSTAIVPGLADTSDIISELATLAKQYGQESIAVTFGNPIFAGAK